MYMVSDVIMLAIITSCVSVITLVVKLCLRSKCTDISLGCLKIHRDTSLEERFDELELNKSPNTSTRNLVNV